MRVRERICEGGQLVRGRRAILHDWLDSWSALGLVVAGMTYQGCDLQLTAYAARDWRANFFPVRITHSIVGGSAWEPTPWRAVQRAAWETLNNGDR